MTEHGVAKLVKKWGQEIVTKNEEIDDLKKEIMTLRTLAWEGWKLAVKGQVPYEAVYLSNEPITEDDVARTKELAGRQWVFDDTVIDRLEIERDGLCDAVMQRDAEIEALNILVQQAQEERDALRKVGAMLNDALLMHHNRTDMFVGNEQMKQVRNVALASWAKVVDDA